MSESLIPKTFLFRFAALLRYRSDAARKGPRDLDKRYRLPSFGELEGKRIFADLRGAWSEEGLAFSARVVGKKQVPWCRASRLDESDGVHFWIDTRATGNVHRASRFCHRFAFMPFGAGREGNQPAAFAVPIHRAREPAKECPAGSVIARAEKRVDGYILDMIILASAMTGYEPLEQPRLGFSYAIIDREQGWQTFSVGRELPFEEDPSLWGTLELAYDAPTPDAGGAARESRRA
ncbi:MAG: hypothetical protein FJ297_03430 [Planctomycetes bacterium]|nr:hypothetical protein [Planctomycetota bacterium]